MRLATQFSLVSMLLMAAPAAHAAGLPQLDHTWFANQVLWLVVTFLALYAIVSLFIVPTVSGVLAARDSAIADAIRDAEAAKRAAETTRTHFESAGQSARTKAAEYTAKAQAENARDAADAMAKLDSELERKLEQADTRIADAKTKAMAGMQEASASVARAMTEKLLGKAVSADDVANTVRRLANAT